MLTRSSVVFTVNPFGGANDSSHGKMGQVLCERLQRQDDDDVPLRYVEGQDCATFAEFQSLIVVVVNERSFTPPNDGLRLAPIDLTPYKNAFELALNRAAEPEVVVLLLVQPRAQGENEIVSQAQQTDDNVHVVNLPENIHDQFRVAMNAIRQHSQHEPIQS